MSVLSATPSSLTPLSFHYNNTGQDRSPKTSSVALAGGRGGRVEEWMEGEVRRINAVLSSYLQGQFITATMMRGVGRAWGEDERADGGEGEGSQGTGGLSLSACQFSWHLSTLWREVSCKTPRASCRGFTRLSAGAVACRAKTTPQLRVSPSALRSPLV